MTDNQTPSDPPSVKVRLFDKLDTLTGKMNDLADMTSDLLLQKAKGQRSTNNWVMMRRYFLATVAIGSLLGYLVFYANLFGFQSDPLTDAVAVISIKGEISPDAEASADNVVPIIERACTASHVKSILLVINSGGGAPSESERMISAIEACKHGDATHPGRRVDALFDSLGASAAYMVGMHANRVYAGRYSLVGSIGAIMRINDASDLASRFGIREHDYRTAPLKGGPSLIAGPTDGDSAEFQRLVTLMGEQFLADVYAQRGKKLKLPRDQLFSGQIWTSQEALDNGLIDALATREDLERTVYKGMKLHDYRTKPSPAEMFGMKSLVHQLVTELRTPTLN